MIWPGREAKLDTALADRYLLAAAPTGRLVAAVIITLKREAEVARGILAHEGLQELPRVGRVRPDGFNGYGGAAGRQDQSPSPGN